MSSRPPKPPKLGASRSDRRSRRPSDDELKLWKSVAKTVTPRAEEELFKDRDLGDLMGSTAIDRTPEPEQPSAPPSRPPAKQRPIGQKPPPPASDIHARSNGKDPVERLSASTPGLDRNTARRLKQGRLPPDGRIDLHGMTIARAHDALIGFILREQASGSRCVLVITGKGGGRAERDSYDWRSNDRIGVLKSMTPQWLRQPPLAALVVGVYEAHQRHGGGGAFYVYLRKTR